MTREQKQKERIFKILDCSKQEIIFDCIDQRHIAAIAGGLGDWCNNKWGRGVFKEWLEINKISYYGEL